MNAVVKQMHDNLASEAAKHAEEMFWKGVAEFYVEGKTGDLDPLLASQFSAMCKKVVVAWVESNAPDSEDET